MICLYFYKNIVLVFTEIFFLFFSGFSGQLFFLDWLPTLYNAVFTSWSCLFAYMYDRDVNESYALRYPMLYKAGQDGSLFNYSAFWRQILYAVWHGLLCFFVPIFGLTGATPSNEDGRTFDHWYYSTVSFALILHLVTFKLFVDSSFWNILSL
jgi:magnesium-transporting ATPase (P-type)